MRWRFRTLRAKKIIAAFHPSRRTESRTVVHTKSTWTADDIGFYAVCAIIIAAIAVISLDYYSQRRKMPPVSGGRIVMKWLLLILAPTLIVKSAQPIGLAFRSLLRAVPVVEEQGWVWHLLTVHCPILLVSGFISFAYKREWLESGVGVVKRSGWGKGFVRWMDDGASTDVCEAEKIAT